MGLEETFETIVRKVIREELKALQGDYGLLTAEEVAKDLGLSDVHSVYRLRREKKLKATSAATRAGRLEICMNPDPSQPDMEEVKIKVDGIILSATKETR